MNDVTKTIINTYSYEIDNNLWAELYDVLYAAEELNFADIGLFTECLLDAGINPLENSKDVYTAYLYGTNVAIPDIPDSIKVIKPWAFSNCVKLKHVFLPDSVEFLDENSFAYCDRIYELTIMNPDIEIDAFAFYDSTVYKINYAGTRDEWTAHGYNLIATIIECSDGEY